MFKHVTEYIPENNYEGTYTYVKKDEYEECLDATHNRDHNKKSLTEIVERFLLMRSSYEFSKDVVIGWYESFDNKYDFKMTCKYDEDIVEYTVENGKLVTLDIKSGSGSSLVHKQVEIKYDIEVDAYYQYLVAIGLA